HLARAAVLKEQAEVHNRALAEHYKQWREIKDELNTTLSVSAIDPGIESVILDRLLPKYEQEQLHQVLRDRITILSVSLVIVGNLLPYPLNQMVQFILGAILGLALLRFVLIRAKSQRERKIIILIL